MMMVGSGFHMQVIPVDWAINEYVFRFNRLSCRWRGGCLIECRSRLFKRNTL